MSPASGNTTPQRRLSARRGSTAAFDPYAVHADINEAPDRTSSSKLTIVRVLSHQPSPSPPITLSDPPSSFTSVSRRRSHRLGAASPPPDGQPTGRLSFAFSSFGSGDAAHGHRREGSIGSPGGGPPSPSASPRMRPIGPSSSPRLSAVGLPSYGHAKPRLTPDQLVDLARQATSPRTIAQIASATTTSAGPSSPAPGSPIMRAHSPALGTPQQGVIAPATFTPLPDDIYLPFIDRPTEVAQLISTPPDAKLFNLLAQTLPKTYDGPLSSSEDIPLPLDPTRWTYTHLHTYLTQTDRDTEPDAIWVAKSGKCIISHSELIWERVKGGFGVPPELDQIEWDWEKEERIKASLKAFEEGGRKRTDSDDKHKERMRRLRAEIREGAPKPGIRGGKLIGGHVISESAIDDDSDESGDEFELPAAHTRNERPLAEPPLSANSVATEDLSADEGKTGRGHWSDWDATIDSPVYSKGNSLSRDGGRPSSVEISLESPIASTHDNKPDDEQDNFIEIEALVDPGSAAGSMLLGPDDGAALGDIAEGEEDEEEVSTDQVGDIDSAGLADIAPAQIQGLRITTAPVHASGLYGVGGGYVPYHPHHPHVSPGTGSQDLPSSSMKEGHHRVGSVSSGSDSAAPTADTAVMHLARSHSRTSSFSSMTGVTIGPFSRSESTGSLAALIAATKPNTHYAGSDAGDSSGYISDSIVISSSHSGHEALGDRLPGQPLFVSNFARLNGIPTLSHSPPLTLSKAKSSSHSQSGKGKVKRTGSIGGHGTVGAVPSSTFLGSKASAGDPSRIRTLSQGSNAGKTIR
ncbi:hypothetical protein FA15DRAFT_304795 [Coprinopsis marcescibilis]|uniref:Uncharacterized protein n=1 Tax=Coprinopsis marcescibilis TaxID=230819 RepID=A0A5C3KZR4_COPMA|nr:hypothetical protein FA15DRAFT_304795 [Coprinopsis marcescibilis]